MSLPYPPRLALLVYARLVSHAYKQNGRAMSLPYPPRLALLVYARLVSHAYKQNGRAMSLPYLTCPSILSTSQVIIGQTTTCSVSKLLYTQDVA